MIQSMMTNRSPSAVNTPDVAVLNSLCNDSATIGLVAFAHAGSHFSHLLLPPLFPVFMREFGLSFADLGLLAAIFFAVSGVGQAISGFVVDRFGARPILLASVGLFVLASVSASLAQGYGGLVLVAVLAGLGNAPFHPVDFTIMNQRVSPQRLGHAFSLHGVAGNLGWAAAPLLIVSVSAAIDWRSAYRVIAVLYVALLALLWWQRDKLQTQVFVRHSAGEASSHFAFLKLSVVWWCFGFAMFSTMTLAVMQNYLPSILGVVHGLDFARATAVLSGYLVCAAAGMVLGGFVAARYPLQSDRVLALVLSVAAGMIALAASGLLGAGISMALIVCTGLAVGIGGPSRDLMIKRATPKGATGRVYGTVYSGFDVGFAAAPVLFGVWMDKGWYSATLIGAAAMLLLAALVALRVGQRSRLADTI
jgi:MFS transporter, FSR family, fosmidomycin resistance protein